MAKIQDHNRLTVWIDHRPTAELWLDDDQLFGLQYDEQWRRMPQAYSFSPYLPLHPSNRPVPATVMSARLRRFFSNLLPEGKALDDAIAANNIPSKSNLMAIIRALGRESAGAMMILPDGITSTAVADSGSIREITQAELSLRIAQTPSIPFSVWDGKVRMSIAGYQEKLPVRCTSDGKLWLTDGAIASTHILKPQIDTAIPYQAINEYFCMRLAAAAGVPTAPVQLIRVPQPVLIVERFDRATETGGNVTRRHIIDGCQALDLPVEYKYERVYGQGRDVMHIRDGASLQKMFSIERHSDNPAAMAIFQLRWTLMQYALGNSDAHAKNMSFYATRQGLAAAPAYDQLCIQVYDKTHPSTNLETRLAMAIGDEFEADKIRDYQWALFAVECGLDVRLVGREMKRLATHLIRKLPDIQEDPIFTREERAFLQEVGDIVGERAMQLATIGPRLHYTLTMYPELKEMQQSSPEASQNDADAENINGPQFR